MAAAAAGAQDPPNLTSLSSSSLDRSGRLRVFGTGFGASRGVGQVMIGGAAAWVAEWSDQSINAYVPEGVGPGPVDVQVITGAGPSNVLSLDVTLRQPDGRRQWRFTCDSLAVRQRLGIGPDGTIYAQDTSGILYALAPDGALRWLLDTGDEGSEGPVVVGADGTVYISTNPLGPDTWIQAVSPAGELLWTFTETGSQGVIAGPGVGPDGNIYAVFDVGGLGAVALDPAGELLWSHPGSPPFAEHGQRGTEIGFGADRFYVAFDERAQSSTSLLFGMGYDGGQDFAVGRPYENAQLVVGSTGNVYLPVWSSSGGIGIGAYDADGNQLWSALHGGTNTISAPDVGPDGRIYVVRNLHDLRAVAADGSDLWSTFDADSIQAPIVSPDGAQVLVNATATMQYSAFKSYSSATGQLLWSVQIPLENGNIVLPSSRPIFEPGGQTAYIAAEPITNPDDNLHCYVYAITAGESVAIFADGFESGGTGAWSATLP